MASTQRAAVTGLIRLPDYLLLRRVTLASGRSVLLELPDADSEACVSISGSKKYMHTYTHTHTHTYTCEL